MLFVYVSSTSPVGRSKGAARTRVVSLMICVFYDSTVQSSTVVVV